MSMPKPIEVVAKIDGSTIKLTTEYNEYLVRSNGTVIHRGRYQDSALMVFVQTVKTKART